MSRPPDAALRHSFHLAYGAGLALCVAWPLLLQGLLSTVIRPDPDPPSELVHQLGYSFTGLTCLAAWFVSRRCKRVRAGFASLPPARRGPVLAREILVYAALFQLGVLFGLLYYGLGGPNPERYGRGFLALTPVMFLVFVPRLQAWREAAREE